MLLGQKQVTQGNAERSSVSEVALKLARRCRQRDRSGRLRDEERCSRGTRQSSCCGGSPGSSGTRATRLPARDGSERAPRSAIPRVEPEKQLFFFFFF